MNSFKILFAGVSDPFKSSGTVRCYRYPLNRGNTQQKHTKTGPAKFFEYQGHDKRGIVQMEVTNDDLHLITAGRDGCIIIYEIKDKEARGGLRRNEGFPDFSDEVLVTKEEI